MEHVHPIPWYYLHAFLQRRIYLWSSKRRMEISTIKFMPSPQFSWQIGQSTFSPWDKLLSLPFNMLQEFFTGCIFHFWRIFWIACNSLVKRKRALLPKMLLYSIFFPSCYYYQKPTNFYHKEKMNRIGRAQNTLRAAFSHKAIFCCF